MQFEKKKKKKVKILINKFILLPHHSHIQKAMTKLDQYMRKVTNTVHETVYILVIVNHK